MVVVSADEVLAEDDVALLLDGALDRAQLDGSLVKGDVDGGIGDGHIDGFHTPHRSHCAFETGLAVIAVDFGDL